MSTRKKNAGKTAECGQCQQRFVIEEPAKKSPRISPPSNSQSEELLAIQETNKHLLNLLREAEVRNRRLLPCSILAYVLLVCVIVAAVLCAYNFREYASQRQDASNRQVQAIEQLHKAVPKEETKPLLQRELSTLEELDETIRELLRERAGEEISQ